MFFLGTVAAWVRERRRNIFHYHDSFGWRRGDPVAIGERLEEKCPDYQSLWETLADDPAKIPPGPLRQSAADQQRSAARELARVAYEVFDLLPLSEKGRGGLSRAEALAVFAKYIAFMNGLAGDARLFPDSPGAGSPSRPASTTPPSADSGGSGSESSGG